MNAMTMLDTIVPKSDQLNADDLIGGPRTIKITKALLTGEEQPVALSFEGDAGKPFKPGKSMRRVLVHIWGPDANVYAGRSMTIYRDEKVMFGGVAVGGIRISHMTDIDRDITVALTVTRANRKPFTVKPLRLAKPQAAQKAQSGDDRFPGDRTSTAPQTGTQDLPLPERIAAYLRRVAEAPTVVKLEAIKRASERLRADVDRLDPERVLDMDEAYDARLLALESGGGEQV